MLHRHESHQLQLQSIPPLLSQSGERLPAAGSTRPETVDMAAHGSQPMTPRQLKCTLAAGLNLLKGARLVLSVVGRQSRLKRADGIGIVVPGEGFIQVSVGLHQPRQHQALGVRHRLDRLDHPRMPADRNGDQTIRSRSLRRLNRPPDGRLENQPRAASLECTGARGLQHRTHWRSPSLEWALSTRN